MLCKNVRIGKIHLIEVDNENGLKVFFSALGASIYAIYFNNKIMTVTPNKMSDFVKVSAYYGKTIGPVTGRIKDGLINVDDTQYQVEKNEGENTLHSGKKGLSNIVFNGKIANAGNICSIMFTATLKGRKGEFPGKAKYYVVYAMSKLENKLTVIHRVVVDKPTPISLTNHAYFHLGEQSIQGLKLKIPASKVIEVNKDDLTPERYIDVPSCLDFRKIAPITKDINNEYLLDSKTKGIDHYYELDQLEEPVILESNKVRLEIKSNYKGLQVYSDNYADDIEMRNISIPDHRGVALEPQDSPLERKTYHKNELYDKYIEYNFIQK